MAVATQLAEVEYLVAEAVALLEHPEFVGVDVGRQQVGFVGWGFSESEKGLLEQRLGA